MLEIILNSVMFVSGGSGIEPDGFKLYKAEDESGPFELLATLPGTETEYNDAPVPNGIDYFYQVTAIWDGEESDPSNTATGTGQNYPPEAPTNLDAVVDYYDVNLTWEFTDLMGDFDHYNIYHKLVGEPDWDFVGSSFTESFTDEITPGEDGVYLYVVTAVDDGDPQLESENSNSAFAPVGNLPPINLVATSNQEDVVPLRWSAPGVRPCTTIAYDDGALENAYYYFASEAIIANRFVASAPVEICTVWVHVLTEGDPYWPWPDGNHDPVEITIWEGDGGGYPGNMLYSEIATCEYGEWISVALDPPVVCNDDMFWVGMNNLSDSGPYDGMGLDLITDYPQNKWARQNGSWSQQDTYAGDQMIRATIVSSGRSMILTENNPTSDLAVINRAIAGGELPVPLDTEEILGFNIYRDTSPDVPIDDDYKINTDYIIDTNYDDEDVVNGTTYYYIAVAVYDNDGDIEFSPPSNEASATPQLGGHLAADPTSIEAEGTVGEATHVPLTLSNDGGLPVNFYISATVSRVMNDIEIPYRDNSVQAKFQSYSEEYDKTDLPPEEENQPVILMIG